MVSPVVSGAGRGRATEVLIASTKLGLTAFGGPVAHLGHFERVYVRERRWLTGEEFAGVVALSQLLPGPASSQAGFLIGLHRAGWRGGLAAWLGFTLPSALLLFAAASAASALHGPVGAAVLQGLKLVAVAVVAQAVLNMARRLCSDGPTVLAAVGAAILVLWRDGAGSQLLAIAAGAVVGTLLCRAATMPRVSDVVRIPPALAWSAFGVFAALLVFLPLAARHSSDAYVGLADILYRSGALVFGGGHVVLPLLRDALVPGGWISDNDFLAGYGLAQAVPGPLFSVAAYVGAVSPQVATPVAGAAVALIAIFLPGLLLAVAGASLWRWLLVRPHIAGALTGVNAAVVGVLAAALYDPVWTTAVHGRFDAAIAAVGFLLLQRWKVAPIAVVAFCTGASLLQSAV